MKDSELLDLRRRATVHYSLPKEFLTTLNSIFEDLNNIPIISGDEQGNNWKILHQGPRTLVDRLKIEGFLEGVREIADSYSKNSERFNEFISGIHIENITPGYPEYNLPLISAHLQTRSSRSYSLNIIGQPKSSTEGRILDKNGYVVETKISHPPIEQIMEKYVTFPNNLK